MSKKNLSKTNVMRLLERDGIEYKAIEYPVDEDHLDAGHVAECLGEDITQVYKTLVLDGGKTGHFVCVIAGNREVNLKKAAMAAGAKKAEMLHVKDLLPLTGYIRGGCSPVGMKKPLPTFFDTPVTALEKVYVSGGRRGVQIMVDPSVLIKYVGGTVADLTD